ncbi:MAG: non-homologous end-joining DNA ligase, partial [Ginsengibacter sp.]
MALTQYNKKRNFKETSEPSGVVKKSGSKLAFVIQRHKASRLHYDFRLEMNGVLKSWAVPKGPSLNPHDKRLAMMVEDHPYGYKDFRGIIPEGNYGAGIVEIWDKGTYTDIDNSGETAEKNLLKGLKGGNLKIILSGKKLKGEFALVKLKGKEDNSWLLIKHNDKYAVSGEYNSEEDTPENSPINKWLEENKKTVKKKKYISTSIKNGKKLGEFIQPMLANETAKPFDDKDWLYEIKWDGYRAIAEMNDGDVTLYSRNGITFEFTYPIIVDQLRNIQHDAVIDGEIVILDEDGKPNFQLLQHYSENADKPIQYCVFDLLRLNGHDTTNLTLLERKELLQKIIPKDTLIKYSDHVLEKGTSFFQVSTEQKLEGIMAKKTSSKYFPGRRTTEWLKIKNHRTQEAIIAGYTQPGGSRKFFGALILGIYDNKRLVYIGHTGTGFNQKLLKEMYEKLQPLVQEESPFAEKVKTNMPVTWVKPELVCEVKFAEKTNDGMLRHPVFLDLRSDKNKKDISMANTKEVAAPKEHATAPKKTAKKKVAGKQQSENDA